MKKRTHKIRSKALARKARRQPVAHIGKEMQLDNQEHFQKAILNAPFPVMIYAEDGEVIEISRVWTELTGYTHQDIPTLKIWVEKAFGQKNGFARPYIDKLYSLNMKVEEGDYLIMTKDGNKRIWSFSSSPLSVLPDGRRLVISIASDITKRKAAEKEIQESAWRLNMVIERAGNGITVSDPNGHFEIFNSKMQEITGYTIDEANGSGDFTSVLYPEADDRRKAIEGLKFVSSAEVYHEAETVIRAKDGSKKTLLVSTSVIRYKDKDMFLSVYRDITERKNSEETIIAAYKMTRSILDMAPIGIYLVKANGGIEYANSAMIEMSGDSREQFESMNVLEIPSYKELGIDKKITSALKGKPFFMGPVEFTSYYSKKYTIRNFTGLPLKEGGENKVLVFVENLTELKKKELELIKLSQAVQQSSAAVVIANLKGEIEYVNPSFTRLTGYTCDEAIGRHTRLLKSGEIPQAVYKKLWASIVSGGEWRGEFHNKKKDGKLYWEYASISPIRGPDGEITNFIKLAEDITERKKSERIIEETRDQLAAQTKGLKKANAAQTRLYKELEKKNKELQKLDKLKSDFISTVSHELRTPLSITKEGISLVLDEVPGRINEKQREVLFTSRNNIDRLARIIGNLLDISKIEAGEVGIKKEFIDLVFLIKQVAEFFMIKVKEKGLMLRVKVPDDGIPLHADGDKMTQVLTNLVSNAIKFTNKGSIAIEAEAGENEVKCSVSDTGIGITKENLPKVFYKFQQFSRVPGAGEKGTGLGLSIAKGIIDAHLGKIWVESIPGKGSRFTFTLPKK